MTHLFSVGVEGYRFFVVTLDLWMIGGIVAVIALIARFVLPKCKALPFRNVKVDEVKLGFQLPSVTIRVDRREQELAYALWVELGDEEGRAPVRRRARRHRGSIRLVVRVLRYGEKAHEGHAAGPLERERFPGCGHWAHPQRRYAAPLDKMAGGVSALV